MLVWVSFHDKPKSQLIFKVSSYEILNLVGWLQKRNVYIFKLLPKKLPTILSYLISYILMRKTLSFHVHLFLGFFNIKLFINLCMNIPVYGWYEWLPRNVWHICIDIQIQVPLHCRGYIVNCEVQSTGAQCSAVHLRVKQYGEGVHSEGTFVNVQIR